MKNSYVEKSSEIAEGNIPKASPLIWINLLLERFSTNGVIAILALYLNRKLNFDQSTSTAIYHAYELLAYSIPIVGAIIADSWLGVFKTILWMSLVFSVGCTVVAVTAIEPLQIPTTTFTIIGLVIAVIGTGSTRANLIAFGGNQFQLPEQAELLRRFFSIQIFFHKAGSILGNLIPPILKDDVSCFGMDDCYPLAFGSSAFATLIGCLIFIWGRSMFVIKPLSGNVFVKVFKCILSGITEKFKQQQTNPKANWLDYAEAKHGPQLVAETKNVMNILVLYLPLPIYWAVMMQQGSRWIFQAARMDGDVGLFVIKPEQMVVFSPLFSIISLPICDFIFYPLLAKVKITTLLQKMTIGGFFAVAAFICSAFVEMRIQNEFISVLWLVPQYFLLALSENFFFVNHISFAYTEAPASMKSVLTSFVYVVIAIGNLFVVIISGTKLFESQANEFFFFAGTLTVFMVLFGFLASRYQPLNESIKPGS